MEVLGATVTEGEKEIFISLIHSFQRCDSKNKTNICPSGVWLREDVEIESHLGKTSL